jgi:peptide/nickel transport system substrate-binding protein
MKKRNILVFALILLIALLAAACQPETIVETVIVEKEGETIIETVVVEKEGETIIETVVVEVEGESSGSSSRGSSGMLTLLYWQAASTMNAYLSGGTKDLEASSMTLEPLARYDEAGNMVPYLAKEIPTLENGGVAEDLTSITWNLKEGIVWSDGTPLTAADVVFSGEYCLNPEMGCNALSSFADVESIEALDDLSVKINFSKPKPFPYGPFVGTTAPIIQAAQFADCTGAAAQMHRTELLPHWYRPLRG